MISNRADSRRAALNLAAGTLWYLPRPFGLAQLLGRRYSLRCVLFHEISDTESSFTRGLGGTITRKNFEAALKFLTKHYTPVSLQDVLNSFGGHALPPRPALVTFDDGYASVSNFAAPLCSKYGVPAVCFVNGSCLDNREVALDNLVTYVANTVGLAAINSAIRSVAAAQDFAVRTLADVFAHFLPQISLPARAIFRSALVESLQISESDLAANAGLYLTSEQLRDLARFNFEIGNHTYTHVHGRPLSSDDFAHEIDANKTALEGASGTKVRSFSVPYGSSTDLTPDLARHLQQSGYEAIFLAEGRTNPARMDPCRFDRVSIKSVLDSALFSEVEVLPRLRTITDQLFTSNAVNSRMEQGMPHAWQCSPRKDSGSCSPVPKENPGL